MRKLVVTCECGQRMQVPRSAVGKTGLCPTCGQSITITNDNAQAAPSRGSRPLNNAKQSWWQGRVAPTEEAKRRFGEAVDLYYGGRYAEALAIFDTLAKQYPGNPDIENGRLQCMKAMRRAPAALTGQTAPAVDPDARLDEETVKRVILEKLLHGGSEATQLQAAELAARLLGLYNGNANGHREEQPAETASSEEGDTEVAASEGEQPADEAAAGA
jgi:nitroreductase